MSKKVKVKGWVVGVVVIMLGAISLGAVARMKREKEDDKATEITSMLSEEDWTFGMLDYSGEDRVFEEGMPNCYRTDYIPYDELNISIADSGANSFVVYFYCGDEDHGLQYMTGLEFTTRENTDGFFVSSEFVWEDRANYPNIPKDSSTVAEGYTPASYVRVVVKAVDYSGEGKMIDIDLDKVIITYNEK